MYKVKRVRSKHVWERTRSILRETLCHCQLMYFSQGKAGLWFPLKFKGIAFFAKGVINLLKIKIQLIFDSIFYFLATKYQLI